MENNNANLDVKCGEEKCAGKINFDKQTILQTGCSSFSPAYPCDTCFRLHWFTRKDNSVNPVENRRGKKAYLIDGVLTNRD